MEEGKGCRQKAQQLKKQRFNKVISDIAANKAFFFSFVKRPNWKSLRGIRELLDSLNQVKETDEYKHMAEISQKTTDVVTKMKKSRDKARLASKPGRQSRYSIVTASKEAIQIIAHVFVYMYVYIRMCIYICV